jgi:hypothetical protein
MKHYYLCMLCAGWLTAIASADIVWSGELYQRAYHDISSIDMNQDGTDDFTFNRYDVLSGQYQDYYIDPASGGIVVEQRTYTLDPVSLDEGTLISSTLSNPGLEWELVWQNSETRLFLYGTTMGLPDYGGLADREGYVGVSFVVEGATHYGWIQTSHDLYRSSPDDQYLYIHGWAYESTPDTPIVAGVIPEPSTGILTMAGSVGLLLHARSRRRR